MGGWGGGGVGCRCSVELDVRLQVSLRFGTDLERSHVRALVFRKSVLCRVPPEGAWSLWLRVPRT